MDIKVVLDIKPVLKIKKNPVYILTSKTKKEPGGFYRLMQDLLHFTGRWTTSDFNLYSDKSFSGNFPHNLEVTTWIAHCPTVLQGMYEKNQAYLD